MPNYRKCKVIGCHWSFFYQNFAMWINAVIQLTYFQGQTIEITLIETPKRGQRKEATGALPSGSLMANNALWMADVENSWRFFANWPAPHSTNFAKKCLRHYIFQSLSSTKRNSATLSFTQNHNIQLLSPFHRKVFSSWTYLHTTHLLTFVIFPTPVKWFAFLANIIQVRSVQKRLWDDMSFQRLCIAATMPSDQRSSG